MTSSPHEKLDNLTVYRRLILLHEELDHLSKRCWSPAAGRAHAIAAAMVRALASGVWRHGIADFWNADDNGGS